MNPRRLQRETICSITLVVDVVASAMGVPQLYSRGEDGKSERRQQDRMQGAEEFSSACCVLPTAFVGIGAGRGRRTASGRRGLGTLALGLAARGGGDGLAARSAGGVEPLGQPAALARGGVLVDRVVRRH